MRFFSTKTKKTQNWRKLEVESLTKSYFLVVPNTALGLGSDDLLSIEEDIVLLLESFFVLNIKIYSCFITSWATTRANNHKMTAVT